MYIPRPVLIAVVTVLLVLATGAAAVLLTRQDDNGPRTPDRYYFEARLEVEQRSPRPPRGDSESRRDVIRAWYEAPHKWRREYAYSDPQKRDLPLLDISDGKQHWTYDGLTNTYFIQELPQQLSNQPELLQQYASSAVMAFSFVLGPLPAEDMDTFFARYQLGGASWRVVGSERLLNRDVQVVEVQQGGGKTTFWIDPRYMFVLRYTAESEGSSIRADVVDLAYNKDIDQQQFTFAPPRAARQVDPPAAGGSGSSGASGSASLGGPRPITVPAGFLAPTYVPDGYSAVEQGGSSSTGGQTTSVYIRLQPSPGPPGAWPSVVIQEQFRAGGLPDSLKSGASLTIGGNTAYRSDAGGETRLTWSVGDIIITLTTDALPLEELQRIGESMR